MTRREKFLREMDALLLWDRLMAALEPVYPRGERGRLPIRLEQMLRMYVVQHFLGLSDEGTEDAIYDSAAVRQFVGIDLSRETAPDATTLLKFRPRCPSCPAILLLLTIALGVHSGGHCRALL